MHRKGLLALAAACVLLLSCGVCFSEGDYDPTSEGYLTVGSADRDAIAFADQLAESNRGLYEQFGVRTALYLFDSMEGMDVTDDVLESLLSIHGAAVGDTADDMVLLVVLDKNDYRIWLGDHIREMCPDEALREVLDAVAAEENETIWAAVSKAYIGVSYRLLAWSIGAGFNGAP